MRIVGGAWRGRPLTAPPGRGTRPTSDKVREAVFDVLGALPEVRAAVAAAEAAGVRPADTAGELAGPLAGHVVLDVFAGSGALGIEALSRGAAGCTFVEVGGAGPARAAREPRAGGRAGGPRRAPPRRRRTPPALAPWCSPATCAGCSRLTLVAAHGILSCLQTRRTLRTSRSVPPS